MHDMKIERISLQGPRVRLEPLAEPHLPGLGLAIRDGRLWEIPVTLVPHPDALGDFLDTAESLFEAGQALVFATLDARSGQVLGSTRFCCIDAAHRRVEIGFTFLAQSSQRTHVNTEAKFLMLCHAFEAWGCHRVELITDERNARSRRAIERIGAQQEGILRRHMVMRDGFVRNTIVYSIVDSEWPATKASLLQQLERSASRDEKKASSA